MHCSVIQLVPSRPTSQAPGPHTLSVLFIHAPAHCLLVPPKAQGSSSGRRFLEFAHSKKRKRKGLALILKSPGSLSLGPIPQFVALLGGLVSVVPPHSLEAGYLQSALQPPGKHTISPKAHTRLL